MATKTDTRAASAEVRHEHGVLFASRRGRLMTAFVELAAEQGYDGVTIIEIVTRAGTSKRTFYEYFVDKQDCLLQSFETVSAMLTEVILAEAGPVDDPIERIRAGIRAYLAALADQPAFTRLFLSESLAAGDALTDRWIAALEKMAEVMSDWRSESRATNRKVPELSQLHALAVICGINEVVVITVHRDGVEALAERADELADLAVTLLTK
ncbi:MAG: TetR/AcrR family transcriptional regulator [Solirubrobacterales bacterium]